MTDSLLDRAKDLLGRSRTAQTLVVYLPVCWLILQVADVFVDQLGLPKWVFVGTLVLIGLGLLVIVLSSGPLAAFRARVTDAVDGDGPATPSPFSRRKLVVGGVVALGVWALLTAGFMGARALGVGPVGALIAKGDIAPDDLVLISAFENRTKDPTLSQTVADALAVDLSQSKLVRVVDGRTRSAALERMKKPSSTPLTPELARELAQREGVAAVLEGEVASLGGATLINCRLVSAKDGAVLAEVSQRSRSSDDLLEAVDEASGEIRNKIGESLKVLRAEPPLEQVTTASLPALKLYSLALRKIDGGDYPGAELLLRQALELDPEFAMAWRSLGTTLGNIDRDRAGARTAFTNAYLYRTRLPERERGLATGTYYQLVQHDEEKAATAYESVLAGYPQEVVALNNLGLIRSFKQQFPQAEELYAKVTALRPDALDPRWNLFLTQLLLGRFEDAEKSRAKAAERFPGVLLVEQMGVILAGAQGDFPLAYARAAEMTAKRPGDPEARYFSLATTVPFVAEQGRFAEAERMGEQMADLNASVGLPGSALTDLSYVVRMHQDRGRLDLARAALTSALRRFPLAAMPPEQRPHWPLAETYGALGDAAAARRELALAEAQGPPPNDKDYGARDAVLGLIALAEGDHAVAIDRLRAASETGQCAICVLPDLGQAYEAAGQTAQAIATYERYDRLPGLAHEERGHVLERLIVLHRSAGDAAKSQAYAARLQALWAPARPPPARLQLAGGAPG